MLYSGKKFRSFRDKKKNSNSCVVQKKPYPPPPPLQVKWSVPYLLY